MTDPTHFRSGLAGNAQSATDPLARPLWRRLLRPIPLLTLFGLVLFGISFERAIDGTSDTETFYEAGRYFWEHHQLIPESDVLRYPPPFHAMTALFASLPFWLYAFVRTGIDVLLLADLPRRFERLSGISIRRQALGWLAAAPFLIDNVVMGQHGAELLWFTTVGLMYARVGRPVLGGGLIAIAVWIKVLPACMLAIPFFLSPARWRTLLGAALGTVVAFGIYAAFTGVPEAVASAGRWIEHVNSGYTPATMVAEKISLRYNNQSLPITLARTFGDTRHDDIRGQVQLARLPLPVIWTLAKLITISFALLMVAMLWRARRHGDDPRVWLGLFAMAALAMLTTSPIVWTFYFIWLLPAMIYFTHRPRLLIALFVLMIAGLASDYVRGLGFHLFLSLTLCVMIGIDLWRRTAAPSPPPTVAASS